MKHDVRTNIKNVLSFTAECGAYILELGIGTAIIATFNTNKVVKALMYIGAVGIATTASKSASKGIEQVVDDAYELFDNVKNGAKPKVIHV